MHLFVCYVPTSHLEKVKDALFVCGGGRFANYDRCSWQVKGEGQFRPLVGSTPFIGSAGATETVEEYRVEMICEDVLVYELIARLKQVHPYEEPAYHAIKISV